MIAVLVFSMRHMSYIQFKSNKVTPNGFRILELSLHRTRNRKGD